jgi:hypothetical protein
MAARRSEIGIARLITWHKAARIRAYNESKLPFAAATNQDLLYGIKPTLAAEAIRSGKIAVDRSHNHHWHEASRRLGPMIKSGTRLGKQNTQSGVVKAAQVNRSNER